MKHLIIKILYFSLPIILLMSITEFALRQIPNDYKYKKQYLDKNATQIETLILGTSHSFFGIDPAFFEENTFNAAHLSQSLDFDWAILEKYKSSFTNLKTIILPISYFTLWHKLQDTDNIWIVKNLVKNYVLYYDIHKANSNSDFSEILSNKMLRNAERLTNWIFYHSGDISCTELGWGFSCNSKNAKNLQKTGEIASKAQTKNDIFSEKNKKILTENIKILNDIYNLCTKNNIKLIFITTPTYFTYREKLNTEQRQAMFEIIYEFINQHTNVSYINYFEDSDFVATDFYDADHLNEIGAEKLTKKLARDIDSLGLLK